MKVNKINISDGAKINIIIQTIEGKLATSKRKTVAEMLWAKISYRKKEFSSN